MKHPSWRALLLGLCGLLPSWHAAAADLTVSAATSLTHAFRELAPLFEAKNPSHKVQLNFGSSGALVQQIVKGAPVDVFASADQESMDRAQAQGAVEAGERRDFVSNTLVVIVPADSAHVPQVLADLTQPAYQRIAIGLPDSVPVGRYTQGALENAGLWAAIEPKTIRSQNVRQALDYVARGEVDAGFVYSTDAALMPGKVRVAQRVPTHKPILYPIAPVAGSRNAVRAKQFVEFVFSHEAQAVLAKHGFGSPDGR
ncbi:MAG: molybdate ABC transporter substrate-binding protein [Methylibium sp.]|uniref:molybdate ABC transporter substrate-binding protein n=1 Tax=Methylibium sp. TaxID=2067992 RepID=UPI0017FDF370|nr:molybdate ABC transporter substrate-binding protein [Methylibium sp.]MBA3597086.1 molybdate ABC transporter substrate-binding protein [Methylibium sp.]